MVVTAVRKTKENRRKANPKTMRAAKKSRITAQTMIIIGPRGTQPALLFSRERTPLCSTSRRRRSENSSPSKEAARFSQQRCTIGESFCYSNPRGLQESAPFLGWKIASIFSFMANPATMEKSTSGHCCCVSEWASKGERQEFWGEHRRVRWEFGKILLKNNNNSTSQTGNNAPGLRKNHIVMLGCSMGGA